MRATVLEELETISCWAESNNLKLNRSKTREMIIPRRRGVMLPETLKDVSRVSAVKILGVTIQANLKVATHVADILAKCMGTFHALRILRFHGLTGYSVCSSRGCSGYIGCKTDLRHTCMVGSHQCRTTLQAGEGPCQSSAGWLSIFGHS